jgi:thiol-disulfide isomerase/thioredoxin
MSPLNPISLNRVRESLTLTAKISRLSVMVRAVGVCLLLALGLTGPSARAEIKPGDLFPAMDPTNLVGGALPATAGKVALVDFCASWCAPCKESFPFYAQLHADYAARGFVIIAVSVDQNPAAFDAFVKKMAPPFPTLRDKGQQLVSEVKVPAMPTCYLIGPDGRVRFVHQGFHGAGTGRDIRQEIDSLFAKISLSP